MTARRSLNAVLAACNRPRLSTRKGTRINSGHPYVREGTSIRETRYARRSERAPIGSRGVIDAMTVRADPADGVPSRGKGDKRATDPPYANDEHPPDDAGGVFGWSGCGDPQRTKTYVGGGKGVSVPEGARTSRAIKVMSAPVTVARLASPPSPICPTSCTAAAPCCVAANCSCPMGWRTSSPGS